MMANKQLKMNIETIIKQGESSKSELIPPIKISNLSKLDTSNNFSNSLTSRENIVSNHSIHNRNITPRKNSYLFGSFTSRESLKDSFFGVLNSGQSISSREDLSSTKKSFSINRRNNSTSLDLRTEFVDDLVFNPLFQRNEDVKRIISKKRIRLNVKGIKSKTISKQ
jgi:hypothetical protein